MRKIVDYPAHFLTKLGSTEDCWLWAAALDRHGYGKFRYQGEMRPAHRISWMLFCGDIPSEMTIDHLCRVRACVNPDHLEVVTSRENTLRGEGQAAIRARQKDCIHGHEFTAENTYYWGRLRKCRTCNREFQRRKARSA